MVYNAESVHFVIKIIDRSRDQGVGSALDAEIEGIDLSEHGEEAYFGGGLASLTGVGIGSSVVLPAGDVPADGPRLGDPSPEPA